MGFVAAVRAVVSTWIYTACSFPFGKVVLPQTPFVRREKLKRVSCIVPAFCGRRGKFCKIKSVRDRSPRTCILLELKKRPSVKCVSDAGNIYGRIACFKLVINKRADNFLFLLAVYFHRFLIAFCCLVESIFRNIIGDIRPRSIEGQINVRRNFKALLGKSRPLARIAVGNLELPRLQQILARRQILNFRGAELVLVGGNSRLAQLNAFARQKLDASQIEIHRGHVVVHIVFQKVRKVRSAPRIAARSLKHHIYKLLFLAAVRIVIMADPACAHFGAAFVS